MKHTIEISTVEAMIIIQGLRYMSFDDNTVHPDDQIMAKNLMNYIRKTVGNNLCINETE